MSSRKSSARPRQFAMARAVPASGPSQLRTNIEVRHQFRYTSTSATLTAINDTTLIAAAGAMAVSATLGQALFSTVKVNQIEIWTPPASQGVATTCSVLFPKGYNSPAREITDTSVSVAIPAHVRVQPPQRSLCSLAEWGRR
jgi:hypothetical protein